MDKATKCCRLTIFLKSGSSISGEFHTSLGTTSSVRPSDALRECKGGFLVLSKTTIHEDNETRQQQAIMVRLDAISYIELPETGWRAR